MVLAERVRPSLQQGRNCWGPPRWAEWQLCVFVDGDIVKEQTIHCWTTQPSDRKIPAVFSVPAVHRYWRTWYFSTGAFILETHKIQSWNTCSRKTIFCFAGKGVCQALLKAKTLGTTKAHICCLMSIGRTKRFNNCLLLKKAKQSPETDQSHIEGSVWVGKYISILGVESNLKKVSQNV